MSSSREDSPDWLHCFQAPTQSALILSSGSESPPGNSPVRENEKENDWDGRDHPSSNGTLKAKSSNKKPKAESLPAKKSKMNNYSKTEGNRGDVKIVKQETPEKSIEPHEPNHSVFTLSSDSETFPNTSLREDNINHKELSAHKTAQYPGKEKDEDAILIQSSEKSPLNEAFKMKSPKKRLKTDDKVSTKKTKRYIDMNRGNDGDMEVAEEEISEKQIGPYVSSSRLPLVLSEKVQRTKALVECEGESIDLSGDVGAVGRIVISDNPSRDHEMLLDLKGTIYKTTIVPSRTFCVVSFGHSEAKIEAIMNDFIQLKPQSNVYEAETMVEGTLDGFSFDSEDEAGNLPKTGTHQTDQNEGAEQQSNRKGRGKAEKTSGAARKKGKTVGGKPAKKIKKKSQVPKKTKPKK